jgi:hypothetical protein
MQLESTHTLEDRERLTAVGNVGYNGNDARQYLAQVRDAESTSGGYLCSCNVVQIKLKHSGQEVDCTLTVNSGISDQTYKFIVHFEIEDVR